MVHMKVLFTIVIIERFSTVMKVNFKSSRGVLYLAFHLPTRQDTKRHDARGTARLDARKAKTLQVQLNTII